MQHFHSFMKSRDSFQLKKHKMQFLQSNINRLQNQHAALLSFIKSFQINHNLFQHIQHASEQVQTLQQQITNLALQKNKHQYELGIKKEYMSQVTTKLKKKLKQFNQKIDSEIFLRQQLQRKIYTLRHQNNTIIHNLQCLPQNIRFRLQQLCKYYSKKLQQKSTVIKNSQLKFSSQLKREQIINIRRQIGLLRCQICYYQYRIYKDYWEKQIKRASQQMQYKNREEILGIFQLRIMNKEYDNIINNNNKRLLYELSIQQCRINQQKQIKSQGEEKIQVIWNRLEEISYQLQGLCMFDQRQRKKIDRIRKLLKDFFQYEEEDNEGRGCSNYQPQEIGQVCANNIRKREQNNTGTRGQNDKGTRIHNKNKLSEKLNFLKQQLTSIYF